MFLIEFEFGAVYECTNHVDLENINKCLRAEIGFDKVENEASKFWQIKDCKIQKIHKIHFLNRPHGGRQGAADIVKGVWKDVDVRSWGWTVLIAAADSMKVLKALGRALASRPPPGRRSRGRASLPALRARWAVCGGRV